MGSLAQCNSRALPHSGMDLDVVAAVAIRKCGRAKFKPVAAFDRDTAASRQLRAGADLGMVTKDQPFPSMEARSLAPPCDGIFEPA